MPKTLETADRRPSAEEEWQAGRQGHFDILFLINCRSQKNLANGPKVGSHFLVQKGAEREGVARQREIGGVSERERAELRRVGVRSSLVKKADALLNSNENAHRIQQIHRYQDTQIHTYTKMLLHSYSYIVKSSKSKCIHWNASSEAAQIPQGAISRRQNAIKFTRCICIYSSCISSWCISS